MVLTVWSADPKFSFAIHKHPNTPAVFKTLKNGIAAGWWGSDSQTYHLSFLTRTIEDFSEPFGVSEDFKYMHHGQYTSSLVIYHLIDKILKSALSSDSNYPAEVQFSLLIPSPSVLNLLKHFKADVVKKGNSLTTLRIKGASLSEVLNKTLVFCYLIAFYGNSWVGTSGDLINRTLQNISAYNLGYYVAYRFKTMLARRGVNTDVVIKAFENKMTLLPGDTQQHRFYWVKEQLEQCDFNYIVDFGCGKDVYYAKRLSSSTSTYICIDKQEVLDSINMISLKDKCPNANLEFYTSIPNLDKKGLIILAEVWEHLTVEEQRKLALGLDNIDTILLTTPNINFNKNFGLENEYRREDHIKEYSLEELNQSIKTIFPKWTIKYSGGIGEAIDGEHVSLGMVLVK